MRVYLIAFGKLRTPGLRESADYYLKLIQPWVEVQEIELKPLTVPNKSAATRLRIQQEESQLLHDKLQKLAVSRVFLLDETGPSLRTREWVNKIDQLENQSVSSTAFCVASSLGFSVDLKTQLKSLSVQLISLGAQTLSHELARVVLLEQLYRTWSIKKGHPYHNEG